MSKSYSFNYIITIHNKENLIKDVINSVLQICGNNSTIYPVLDGCTDMTEKIIDEIILTAKVPIIKLYAPNVHEIKSINIGLKGSNQEGFGFNILLQDDVLLKENNFESNIIKIYESIGYDHIGVLALRHGVNVILNSSLEEIEETDLIESYYGHGFQKNILSPGMVVKRMIGVRSPECLSFNVVKKIGYMDEILAPYTYDNHDYSLRCLEKGFKNYVYSVNFESDVKWGGMRKNPHPEVDSVMQRNRKYLYTKHFNLINTLNTLTEYNRENLTPFSILGIPNIKFKKKLNIRFRIHVIILKIRNYFK
jgi:glycosyltransferase involved in cell wall biosynthesis